MRRRCADLLLALLSIVLAAGCASTDLPIEPRLDEQQRVDRAARRQADYHERGIASWYGAKFHGRRTASGEIFDMNRPSAAHRLLPFGTTVRVRDLATGREIVVRINDRGPFVRGRIIDLSRAAAEELGILRAGVAEVELSVVHWGGTPAAARARRTVTTRETAGEPEQHAVVVQAGAFRQRRRAEALVRELRALAEFTIESANGWHRVRAGGLSANAARRLIARLAARGVEAIVVADG